MAPAHASGDAMTRVVGSSEENWTKATALGTGTSLMVIALRRSVESHEVAQACREVMDQHALLRAQIVENAKGKLAFLVKSESVAANVEVCPWPSLTSSNTAVGDFTVSGAPDDGLAAAVNKVMRDEINTPFVNGENITDPPLDLFQVHLYAEKAKAQTIVALRFHCGGPDRVSAYIVTQHFFTALNAIVDGQTVRLPQNPGKDVILPPMDDLLPKGKSSKSFFQKGFDTLGYALSASKYPLLPFSPTYAEQRKEPFKSDFLSYTLGKAGTADLLAACKKEKTTLAAALAAAFLKAAANTKELRDKKKDEFSFTSLVDCRPYFDPCLPADTVGNYIAGFPQSQQAKEGVSFWELARSVATTTEKDLSKSKQFSEIPVLNMLFAQVLKHPNVTPQSSRRTALFSMFVDETPLGQWKDTQKLQLASVSGPLCSMHGVGPCFAVCEVLLPGNDLSITLTYPQPVFTRSQMQAYAASAIEFLSNAAAEV